MKLAFCLCFAYSLTMEYNVALIGCIFTFRIFWSSMKNLCVFKRKMWKLPLPTAWESRVAWAPLLHIYRLSLTKPLSIFKIAWMCIHSECWYTTDSNNAPGIHNEVNSRLPLLCSFPFFLCEKDATASWMALNHTSGCLPWSSSCKLGGYTVSTYPCHLLCFQYDKDLCQIKLCCLQDFWPAVFCQRLFSILNLRSEVHYLQSAVYSLQSAVCKCQTLSELRLRPQSSDPKPQTPIFRPENWDPSK